MIPAALIAVLWSDTFSLDIHVARPSYVAVRIPYTIDPGAEKNYPALRIIDSRGREIPFALDALPRDEHPPSMLVAGPEGDARTNSEEPGTQIFQTDLEGASTVISSVVFRTDEARFERQADIQNATEINADTGRPVWNQAASVVLSRFDEKRGPITFPFSASPARYWRVVVHNGGDAPLAHLRIALLLPTHDAVFLADPSERYRLLALPVPVEPPTYDLAALLAHKDWRIAGRARVLDHARATTVPWSERSPWLLFATCALVGISLIATLLLPSHTPPPKDEKEPIS